MHADQRGLRGLQWMARGIEAPDVAEGVGVRKVYQTGEGHAGTSPAPFGSTSMLLGLGRANTDAAARGQVVAAQVASLLYDDILKTACPSALGRLSEGIGGIIIPSRAVPVSL